MSAEDTTVVPAEDKKSPFDITVPEPLAFETEAEGSEASAKEVEVAPADGTPPTEPTAVIGDEVLNAAVAAGLPERVAQSFGSERELRAYLERFKTPKVPQTPSVPALLQPKKFDLQLDSEAVDPEIAKHISAMNDHYAGQMQALHEHFGRLGNMSTRMGAVEGFIQQQTRTSFTDAVDDFAIATKDRKAIFGSERKPNRTSSEFTKRAQLASAAERLRKGYAASNEAVPPRAALLEQAFRLEFGGESAASERSKLERSIESRKGQMTARPTQKDLGEEPRSTHKAELAVAEKLQEQGALY